MSSTDGYVELRAGHEGDYLFVEGGTDKTFIDKLVVKNLNCVSMGGFIDAHNEIMKDYYRYLNFLKNNKINETDAKKISDNLAEKSSRQSIKNTIEKNKDKRNRWFGLVDKDFTNDKSKDNILVTPTHDLETFLLKTDDTIFQSPEEMVEAYEDALYLSYLIGLVKQYLQSNGYILQKLLQRDYNGYKQVIEVQKKEIKLKELIDLLIYKRKDNKKLEQNEKLKLKKEIENGDMINLDEDEILARDDLYNIANGHDISNIIKLLCENKINLLVKDKGTEKAKVNKVELAIIEQYNLKKFEKSTLCNDMVKRKLIPTAI